MHDPLNGVQNRIFQVKQFEDPLISTVATEKIAVFQRLSVCLKPLMMQVIAHKDESDKEEHGSPLEEGITHGIKRVGAGDQIKNQSCIGPLFQSLESGNNQNQCAQHFAETDQGKEISRVLQVVDYHGDGIGVADEVGNTGKKHHTCRKAR